MKILWSDFAKNELKKVFKFYQFYANIEIAKKISNKIIVTTKQLEKYPTISQIEESVNHINKFRCLVENHFKIVEYIDYDIKKIYIVDIFDTRQNPEKMYRNILI